MIKKIVLRIVVAVAIVLLIPLPTHYKDGGTVEYKAILYSVTNYHSIRSEGGFYTGVEVKICGFVVYDNTTF